MSFHVSLHGQNWNRARKKLSLTGYFYFPMPYWHEALLVVLREEKCFKKTAKNRSTVRRAA